MRIWLKDGQPLNCDNCAYSQRLGPNHMADEENLLQCRRYPPSVVLGSENPEIGDAYYALETAPGTRVPAPSFIFVQGSWFCGEHHALHAFGANVSVEIT